MQLQVIDCSGADEYEQHACVNDCVRFQKLPNTQDAYRLCSDEQCPKCGEKRFDVRSTPSGDHFTPRKRFYRLGLRRAGQQLMANAAFRTQRGKGRDSADDVYTTQLATDMDAATAGAVFHPDNSLYEIFLTLRSHSPSGNTPWVLWP